VSNIYETEKYIVRQASDTELVVGEDGQYKNGGGYVVINRETNIVEHSTIMLPGAIFQCQHFNDTLVSLLSPVEEGAVDIGAMNVPEDVVPN
jgi:hypothetical protein